MIVIEAGNIFFHCIFTVFLTHNFSKMYACENKLKKKSANEKYFAILQDIFSEIKSCSLHASKVKWPCFKDVQIFLLKNKLHIPIIYLFVFYHWLAIFRNHLKHWFSVLL